MTVCICRILYLQLNLKYNNGVDVKHEDFKLTEMLAHLKIFETPDLLFGRELINFLNWPPDA